MKRATPFAAAIAYALALQGVAKAFAGDIAGYQSAIRRIAPLRHRGKGGPRPFVKGSQGITREHEIHVYKLKDGATKQVAWPVQRSKYMPHQGKREQVRRSYGGFHTARRLHDFYNPGAPYKAPALPRGWQG